MWKRLGSQSNGGSRQLIQGANSERKLRPFIPKTCNLETPRKSITNSGIFTDRQRRERSRDRSVKGSQTPVSGKKLVQFAKVLTKNDETVIMDDDYEDRRLQTESTKGKLSTDQLNQVNPSINSHTIKRRSSILKTSNLCKSYIEEDSEFLIFGQQKPVSNENAEHPLFGIEAAVHCSGASSKEQYENKISRGVQSGTDQINEYQSLAFYKESENLRKKLNNSDICLNNIRAQVIKVTSQFYSGMSILEDRKQRILGQMGRIR